MTIAVGPLVEPAAVVMTRHSSAQVRTGAAAGVWASIGGVVRDGARAHRDRREPPSSGQVPAERQGFEERIRRFNGCFTWDAVVTLGRSEPRSASTAGAVSTAPGATSRPARAAIARPDARQPVKAGSVASRSGTAYRVMGVGPPVNRGGHGWGGPTWLEDAR